MCTASPFLALSSEFFYLILRPVAIACKLSPPSALSYWFYLCWVASAPCKYRKLPTDGYEASKSGGTLS